MSELGSSAWQLSVVLRFMHWARGEVGLDANNSLCWKYATWGNLSKPLATISEDGWKITEYGYGNFHALTNLFSESEIKFLRDNSKTVSPLKGIFDQGSKQIAETKTDFFD